MSLRASLRPSSGSLAPTWPLTTSKRAKCLPWSARRLRTFLVPQHLTLQLPLPLPHHHLACTACFCWHFLPPNFGAVTFFSALSLSHTHIHTQRSQFQFPLMCFVVRCFLCTTVAACFSCRALVGYSFMHIDFRSVLFICRTSHGRTEGRTEPVSPCVAVCLAIACLCAVTGQEVFKATFNVVSSSLRHPRCT